MGQKHQEGSRESASAVRSPKKKCRIDPGKFKVLYTGSPGEREEKAYEFVDKQKAIGRKKAAQRKKKRGCS